MFEFKTKIQFKPMGDYQLETLDGLRWVNSSRTSSASPVPLIAMSTCTFSLFGDYNMMDWQALPPKKKQKTPLGPRIHRGFLDVTDRVSPFCFFLFNHQMWLTALFCPRMNLGIIAEHSDLLPCMVFLTCLIECVSIST